MISLRPARPADVTAIEAIAVAAYQRYVPRIGRPPAPMTVDYAREVDAGGVVVAVADGTVVGFAVIMVRPDHVSLENVAVAPDAQGRGIGNILLARAEDQARHHGLNDVRLFTNEAMTENLGYYARRGYVETHRATQDGFRRVFFRKSVTGAS